MKPQIIVLVGLMGAGKTTVGKRLAKVIGCRFSDSDDEIVEAAGCSIPDLFAVYGEPIFRDLEERVIARMLKAPAPQVIATGGGAWMSPAIRSMVQEKATSIWLKAELDVLLDRVGKRNTRPLLAKGNRREILGRLMRERYPVYEQADITINSDDSDHECVVQRILHVLESTYA